MSAKMRPTDPLIVIMGSTGTGKSDLAVELAIRFGGEIINADAMQMYSGLPVVTNQITEAERRGVPHYLLAHISLDQETWAVGDWKREAQALIGDIRSRGKLPIVVGGTHYYLNGLLFEDILVAGDTDTTSDFPVLDEPTEVLLAKLREVDPVMADRWHHNDRRKIRRSLEIFLRMGRKASDIYAEQQLRQQSFTSPLDVQKQSGPWETLLFWVYSEPETLKTRLDKRVDKMEHAGLMTEIQEMFSYLAAKKASGVTVDMTRGIWQTIGFKEFRAYLELVNSDSQIEPDVFETMKAQALEDMKTATRQYARSQIRWIRRKLIPLLKEEPGALAKLFLVDSTDVSAYAQTVVEPASTITRAFLQGEPLPAPEEVSDVAREELRAAGEPVKPRAIPIKRTCELCHITLVSEDQWQKHLKSRRHHRVAKNAKKRALAIIPNQPAQDVLAVDEAIADMEGLEADSADEVA
ncbi:tRNA dimethylallyltransferase, mitochondrial [Ceratocystis fimbriata CBS 114723]|uniref:tRNA dimethylallyltransferase n=1 Tax=Ceratocystis fimbriata CBS 114723 TaxID=1035309 RepID=A0A2C5WTN8_9PEZI|nr:tRNA dimethylallyltransferase, mitochondrial [Ceratocystis fimbriata CBS 114723]